MTLFKTILGWCFLLPTLLAADRPAEIPLWPGGAPGSEGKTAKEVVMTNANGEQSVWSIHNPSLTPYLPSKEKATGTAIRSTPAAVEVLIGPRTRLGNRARLSDATRS